MLTKNMECIDKFAFHRDNQRDCILSLYPKKDEKSVFRGMVIPSLRHLGFILGYADLIRLSANAELLLAAKKVGGREFKKVLRAIFLEIDSIRFQFIEEMQRPEIKNSNMNQELFTKIISEKIEAPSKRQKEERIKKWLRILQQCELIKKEMNFIYLQEDNLEQARRDISWESKSDIFRTILFEEYSSISNMSAGIVDIADLRKRVALCIYEKEKEILTERQFDELLKQLPMTTDEYIISLGHPMGAEEKLFFYKDNYYRTLSITVLKKGE